MISNSQKGKGSKNKENGKKERKIQFVEEILMDKDDGDDKGAVKPGWYEELSDDQIRMFKEVFDLLDSDRGGSLDSRELFKLMRELDVELSEEEISSVLKELDNDGSGEIDFDEFLYHMTATDRYLDMLAEDPDRARLQKREKYSKRQSLFFSAITKFALKNSVGEITRYYAQKARQVPHVISHYTAGARVIGLTDRQLARHLKDMQAIAKDQDSPYAKPLLFVVPAGSSAKKHSPDIAKKKRDKILEDEDKDGKHFKKAKLKLTFATEQIGSKGAMRARRTAIYADNADLTAVRTMAEKGSVVCMLPEVHLLPQLSRLASAANGVDFPIRSSTRKRDNRRPSIPPPLTECTPSPPSSPSTDDPVHETSRSSTTPTAGCKPHREPSRTCRGWTAPPIERNQVPLPILRLSKREIKNPTIDDLPNIRKKVSVCVNKYYSALRKKQVRTAWKQWDTMKSVNIPQGHSFRQVFRAYSPHTEEECFVICPWIPGPRYTSKSPIQQDWRPLNATMN